MCHEAESVHNDDLDVVIQVICQKSVCRGGGRGNLQSLFVKFGRQYYVGYRGYIVFLAVGCVLK